MSFPSETNFLIPIVILLAIVCITPLIVGIFRIKIIPTFAIEIIIGIIIAVPFNKYIAQSNMTSVVDGIYFIGLSFIMFLSGYDIDFNVFKADKDDYKHIHPLKVSIIILVLIYVIAFGASWFLVEDYNSETAILQVLLITLIIAGTFSGLIVPLIKHFTNKNISPIFINLVTLAELASIVFLSIYMIAIDISEGYWLFGLVMVALIILAYLIMHKRKISLPEELKGGAIHLPFRILVLAILSAVLLSNLSGGEYILGAFLIGLLVKALKLGRSVETVEDIVYGLFAPMFYVIVGTKINIQTFVDNPSLWLTVLYFIIAIFVSRLPILLLLNWFKLKPVISNMILSTATIIVSIAAGHIGTSIGVFTEEFCEAFLLASVIMCIIPPIIYQLINYKNNIEREIVLNE